VCGNNVNRCSGKGAKKSVVGPRSIEKREDTNESGRGNQNWCWAQNMSNSGGKGESEVQNLRGGSAMSSRRRGVEGGDSFGGGITIALPRDGAIRGGK